MRKRFFGLLGLGRLGVRTQRATQDAAWLLTSTGKGAGFRWFTVQLDEATCSDGMSSRRYPYGALGVTSELGFVSGCFRMQ